MSEFYSEARGSAGSAFPTTDEVRDVWVDHMSLMPDDVPAFQEIFDDWLARTLKEEGAANSAEPVKTAPEPQGEPSGAQVIRDAARRLLADVNPKHRPAPASLMAEDVRIVATTALRAAMSLREGGVR